MKRVTLLRLLVGLSVLTAGAILLWKGCTNAAFHGKPNHAGGNFASPLPSAQPEGQTEGQTDCRIIQHAVGATEICNQPQRVIVLGPYLLEPLLALGLQPTAFADHMMLHQRDYDNPNQQIPYLGSRITRPVANIGTAYTPSIESILKAQPDLILGTEGNASEYDTLSGIAPTLLFHWDEPEETLRAIAQAVDRSDQAEHLLAQTEQRLAAAREAFAAVVEAHPKMLILSSDQLQEMTWGSSALGLCSELVEELGFQLVAPPGLGDADVDALVPISLEILPQFNDADSIILLGSNFGELQRLDGMNQFEAHQLSNLKQAWEKSAIAQSLDASKAGRVYFIPAYLCLGLPGPIGTELYLEELKQQLLASDE